MPARQPLVIIYTVRYARCFKGTLLENEFNILEINFENCLEFKLNSLGFDDLICYFSLMKTQITISKI